MLYICIYNSKGLIDYFSMYNATIISKECDKKCFDFFGSLYHPLIHFRLIQQKHFTERHSKYLFCGMWNSQSQCRCIKFQ